MDVEKNDIGTITKEGYYASCVLALIAAIELALIFGGSFSLAVYSVTIVDLIITLIALIFEKKVINLSRKILTKRNML